MSGATFDIAFTRTVEALVRRCDGNEAETRRIVLALGLPEGKVRRFDRELDTLLAVRLLNERVQRTEIRDRLVARGWSRRNAYRLIDDALCRRSPTVGTLPRDHLAIEINRETA